ncbi:MAG: assimilatory sulfite reductase (NADPH) flavoprotein subunit [Saprospiraceae bacterium]|nr:assimilatory sulfite reductase (NADPH) flavoprotein subunit [Saprospiraceae bacterium]
MSDLHTALPPFDERLLRQLRADLDGAQQLWLSGYLYGLSVQQAPQPGPAKTGLPASANPAAAPGKPALTILYGSQTGNSKSLAQKAAQAAGVLGFPVSVLDMNDYAPQQLKNERWLLLVVSTHGEGEPPAAAETLHQFLHSARAPQLPELRFGVLALGDRSYAQFCQTGRDFDEKLAQLGARRLVERAECDVDFMEEASRWISAVLDTIDAETGAPAAAQVSVANALAPAAAVSAFDRKNPFAAPVLEKIQLNGRGSSRETWHLELSLEGSGLRYEPGDALGVWPQNPSALVQEVLRATILPAQERVDWDGEKTSLQEVLRHRVELSLITRDVLEKLFARTRYPKLSALLQDPAALRQYTYGRDIADLLREFPDIWSAEALLRVLRRLQPRLYSIASGPSFAEGEAHLTVSALRYSSNQRPKQGVASTWLADGLPPGAAARVFVERNEYFKLPADPSTPILMIGPGTGVAPFRAFVQEREALGAKGKSWLFFGNPHFETDFLYQTEWLQALKKGSLSRLDVAFSRDQAHKVYVQHQLVAKGREVFDWLENGAQVYVCGDKNHMAADVQIAFRQVLAEHGGLSAEQAEEYLKTLKKQRRYLEDVY